jgi:hypothetical protein
LAATRKQTVAKTDACEVAVYETHAGTADVNQDIIRFDRESSALSSATFDGSCPRIDVGIHDIDQ